MNMVPMDAHAADICGWVAGGTSSEWGSCCFAADGSKAGAQGLCMYTISNTTFTPSNISYANPLYGIRSNEKSRLLQAGSFPCKNCRLSS